MMGKNEREKLLKDLIINYNGENFKGDLLSLDNLKDYKETVADVLSIDLTPNEDGEINPEILAGFEPWEIQLAFAIIKYQGIPWVKNDGSTMILNLNDLRKIITKIRFGRKRIYELYFTGKDLRDIIQETPEEEIIEPETPEEN